MKKALLSATFVITFAIYAVHQMLEGSEAVALGNPIIADNSDTASPSQTTQNSTSVPSQSTNPTPTPKPTPTPAPAPTPTPKPKGQYNDGTYTGSVADAYYGNIQVQATISGGKIASVTFLQYPNDRSTSRMINGQAMPYLKQEAIAAQSANVDIVSGATDSSQAFIQSLSSALAKARA